MTPGRLEPTDEVFTGSGYTVGTFACGPDDWRWSAENWIGPERHVVFPGTPVWILPFGAHPVLGTANHVLVYDNDVIFRRRLHAPEGDRCSFLRVQDGLAEAIGLTAGASARGSFGGIRTTLLDAFAFAQHRRIVAAARTGGELLPLDELVFDLLGRLASVPTWPAGRTSGPATGALVESTKAVLADRLGARLSVPDVARAVHYSPYHLGRVFRRETGYTLHTFRQHLRLRRSFELLQQTDQPIGEIGIDLGFDSHSHFARTFRRAFGRAPGAVRREGAAVTA